MKMYKHGMMECILFLMLACPTSSIIFALHEGLVMVSSLSYVAAWSSVKVNIFCKFPRVLIVPGILLAILLLKDKGFFISDHTFARLGFIVNSPFCANTQQASNYFWFKQLQVKSRENYMLFVWNCALVCKQRTQCFGCIPATLNRLVSLRFDFRLDNELYLGTFVNSWIFRRNS